ncbi:MAG: hypothetical protein K1X65_23275 [Caldilineales bacterium]|nr:hypothetical protein [Caldilineales bacterium]MCW5857865.1 hypothetical protein [Caldilineales bacterium]
MDCRLFYQTQSAATKSVPIERAAQVYDFARFLQTQAPPVENVAVDLAWLDDSEEEMQAEDVKWEGFYRQHRERFMALREAALDEISAGTAQPMFDLRDEWMIR